MIHLGFLITMAACICAGMIANRWWQEAKEQYELEQEAKAYKWLSKKMDRLESQPWLPADWDGAIPESVPHYALVDLTTGEIID